MEYTTPQISPPCGCLFTRLRPSPAAANWARFSESDISQAASFSSVSAPEDGRTPLESLNPEACCKQVKF